MFIAAIYQSYAPTSGINHMIGIMRLFTTFIRSNTEMLIIAEISAILSIPMITPDIQCELLSMVECALSMSVSSEVLLKLFQEKAENSPIPVIYDCISYLIENSRKIGEQFLMDIWNTVSPCIKEKGNQKFNSEKNNDSLTISAAIVGSVILKNVSFTSQQIILNDVLGQHPNDPSIYCAFLMKLKSLDICTNEYIHNIVHLISTSNSNSCQFLSLIPLFVKSKKPLLVIQSFHYLIRGLKVNGYIVPCLCLDTLRSLQNELKEIDFKESSVIITGLYFAYTRFQSELKTKSYETLHEILSEKSDFRDQIFKIIDASVLQAILRDIVQSA